MNKKIKVLVSMITILLCGVICYLSFLVIDNLLELDNMNNNSQKTSHGNTEKVEQFVEKIEETETAKKNTIVISCYRIYDAVKLLYIESLLTDETINSGNVTDLNVESVKTISGTWSIDDGDIILSKVVIDGYECNTVDNKIDCFKIN